MRNVSGAMLELRNICKAFGDVRVLNGVSFCLEKGFVYTLKDDNGSGKTTLVNIISGFLKLLASKGKIIFEEKEITASNVSEMIKHGIVYMPQKNNVFEDFSVKENLSVSSGIYSKAKAKERTEKVFEILPKLKSMRKRTPFHLSVYEKEIHLFMKELL